ncbi:MAG: hypothetical protein PCFJNLEI_04146 [Verrucomicrobiae bacterium]|nr:hypothetical protein [Verrucomicrobiae bacterium]
MAMPLLTTTDPLPSAFMCPIVSVPPFTYIVAPPNTLLMLATMVTSDRISTAPAIAVLLPRTVSVPVPAPVWLVTTKVLPALSVTLLMIALTPLPAVANPVLENASVASLDTVTLSKR